MRLSVDCVSDRPCGLSCHPRPVHPHLAPSCPYVQISKLLVYSPLDRIDALPALTHSFFDELREPGCRLPNSELLVAFQRGACCCH